MSWLDSPAIKRLGYSTDVVVVVAVLGGAIVGLEAKGHDWGAAPAVIAGGLAGWFVGCAAAFAIRRALSRPCPGCAGKGKLLGVRDSDEAADVCSRCGGAGRIV